MKNPLNKRYFRELKNDFGKYIALCLFLIVTIGFCSGFLVADGSTKGAYDESFEKYNIEDGHFILAKEADFFSIGTNDLTGYTMAVDRGNAEVAYLYSAYNPAVLRSIERVIKAGRAEGIMVGMCGEAAADPLLAPLLISFGMNEFSVSATSILATRKGISLWTKEEADAVAAKAMSLTTEAEVEAYLKSVAKH